MSSTLGFITAKYIGGMRLNNIFLQEQPLRHGGAPIKLSPQ